MHASADRRNVLRTIMVAICAMDLGGALVLPDGDARAPGADVSTWIRVSLMDTAATEAGRIGGNHVTRQDMLLSVDVFQRAVTTDGSQAIDAIDGIASLVADELRYSAWLVKNYVANPTGTQVVSGVYIRNIRPPVIRRLSSSDGYQRRVVDADLFLHIRQG